MLNRSRQKRYHPDRAPVLPQGVTRRLTRRDRKAIIAHLSGLSPPDRRLRFMGAVNAAAIAAYVEATQWRHAVLIGRFHGAQLVGLVELIPSPLRTAELAVSVDATWRGQGIATALIDEALALARARRLRRVHLLISPENRPMLELAERSGAIVQRKAGVVTARIWLAPKPRWSARLRRAFMALLGQRGAA